jgi:hypothetical protein
MSKEKMVKMEIEVPKNWKTFLEDVASRWKKDPAKYWGDEFIGYLESHMSCEHNALFYHLQTELEEKHGIAIER